MSQGELVFPHLSRGMVLHGPLWFLFFRYVNPTYMVRSVRANAADNVYCSALAHSAVHGSFAGFTNCMVTG